MTSLRDRLRARHLPTAEVPIARDPVAYAGAEQGVEIALRTLQQAQLQGYEGEQLNIFRERLAAAQQVLAEQPVEVLQVRCLAVEEWEALVAAHPPTDEQAKQGWQWNTTTFRPALLAECVVTPEGEPALSADVWRELAREKRMRAGELDLVFGTAVQVNGRQPDVHVGKGWSATGS